MGNRIAFGTITNELIDSEPYIAFLKNAHKYGHLIECLIIAYNNFCDPLVVEELQRYCDVIAIKSGSTDSFLKNIECYSLEDIDIHNFLGEHYTYKFNKPSYGTCRNTVLLAALVKEIEFLIFFDIDIKPQILKEDDDKGEFLEEIDYVGAHLKYLIEDEDVVVTTSEYTGYYVIPYMEFPNFKDLLYGLQKDIMYDDIVSSKLVAPIVQNQHSVYERNTNRVHSGNMGIDLRKPELLSPFFSVTLVIDNECYLGRGEDALFAPLLKEKHVKCLDIDVRIFHNVFGNYPATPDMCDKRHLDKLYYACMGWIIRNPFMNWINEKYGITKKKVNTYERYKALVAGSESAVEHFGDNRFLHLPVAFELAEQQLSDNIERFSKFLEIWDNIVTILKA